MEIIPESLQTYVEDHSEPESVLLKKVNRETYLHELKPRMLSGHLQGRLLSMLSKMVQPERILEIGTYTGYATLCLAEGLTQNGRIITLEKNNELAARARRYFQASDYAHQIELRVGNASEMIPTLQEHWDLVFIDADKENNGTYFELTLEQLNPGGYMIIDNVLWSGRVIHNENQDVTTKAIQNCNNKIAQDKRVQNIILPIRDGLMVIRKL